MKKITQIVVLMALTITTTLAQQKGISWVHGLKSGSNFWANQRALFEAERSQININASHNRDYNTTFGVNAFANQVAGNNIGIGHSMGGLAVREASRRSSTTFQAMITCGAPLRGAKIMNSFRSGAVDNAINNGVWNVTRGPMAGLGFVSYIVSGIAANQFVQLLRLTFAPNFQNANVDYGYETVTDLSEGSIYINNINNYSGAKPTRAAIWGNENSPVHWRLASSTMRYNSNQNWQANEDENLVNVANAFADIYFAKFVTNATAAVISAISLNAGGFAYSTFVAFEWKAGSDYLRGQSESDWATLIGADQAYLPNSATVTTTQFTCSYQHYYNECSQLGVTNPAAAELCRNACWAPITYTYRYALQGGSDGLVAAPSQRGDYTEWSLGAGDLYEATGVNHAEMRGHTNMSTQFRRIFDRGDELRAGR